MIVNKEGKMISNTATPIVEFSDEESYNSWKTNLPSGLTENDFIVILDYAPEVGSYFQVDYYDDLLSLPSSMKVAGVLYGSKNDHTLYGYDNVLDEFYPFNS